MKERKLNRARAQMHLARNKANQAEQQKQLVQAKLSELKAEISRLRLENTKLHNLNNSLLTKIQSDAFAITFQSMGQYRSALLNEFTKLNRFTEKFLTNPRLTTAVEQMNKVAQTIIKEANHENI